MARTFAVNVLTCSRCHGRMRLFPPGSRATCAATEEATEVPRRSPGRGLPYWKSPILRRKALGDEDGWSGGDDSA